LNVNLAGSFRPAQAFRPQLGESRGSVLNIASMSSYFGLPTVPGYTASKGGVVALTRALAVAWAPHGIRVNAIAPGWVRTKLTAPVIANADRNRAILARTPLGRWAEPDEMAGAALFLASPAAGFITGVTLPVDGGYSAA
jgi:NAD(P)-dependent dehydrogenase (short-subunit alcohol dehydrogenase family)